MSWSLPSGCLATPSFVGSIPVIFALAGATTAGQLDLMEDGTWLVLFEPSGSNRYTVAPASVTMIALPTLAFWADVRPPTATVGPAAAAEAEAEADADNETDSAVLELIELSELLVDDEEPPHPATSTA